MADDDWRFSVEEVGNADADESSDGESDAEDSSTDADDPSPMGHSPLEPGSPSLENALFVLLGVFVTLFVIARAATLVAG